MNDPHVQGLRYSIENGDHVDYARAVPLEHEEQDFSVRVADGRAHFTMKSHFASVDEARAAVEPFLRVWELDMALHYGPGVLNFVYERPEIIDRKPTPGSHVMIAEAGRFKLSGQDVSLTVGFASFPPPPSGMARDPIVDLMFARYALYREGGTTLADAAYYCLTCLELGAGGDRSAAARRYAISAKVLSRLGELTDKKGGRNARKAGAAASAFAPAERDWLVETMRVIIRRAAEIFFDPHAAHPQITMANLPLHPAPTAKPS